VALDDLVEDLARIGGGVGVVAEADFDFGPVLRKQPAVLGGDVAIEPQLDVSRGNDTRATRRAAAAMNSAARNRSRPDRCVARAQAVPP
jgi:hypothetical protein